MAGREKMSGNDDKKGKVGNCHSTRSYSGLSGHPEDWRQRQRDYPIKSGNDRKRRMSGRGKSDMTIRKGKLSHCHSTRSCSGLTGASGRLAATVRGLPDQVG